MDVLKDLNKAFSTEKLNEILMYDSHTDAFNRKLEQVVWFNAYDKENVYFIPTFLERIVRKFHAEYDIIKLFYVKDGILYSGSYPAFVKVDLKRCGFDSNIPNGDYALNPYSNMIKKFTDKAFNYLMVINNFENSLKNLSEIRWFSFSEQDDDFIYGLPTGRRFIPTSDAFYYDKYKLNLAMQLMNPYKHRFLYNEDKSLLFRNSNVTFLIEGDYVNA